MKCILLDDEPLACEELAAILRETCDWEIVGQFSNPIQAVPFLKTKAVDVVFSDIEMPFISGMEFAQALPVGCMLIFTTAYSQYAIKSYEVDALDYLLKPIAQDRLVLAIQKAEQRKRLQLQSESQAVVEKRNVGPMLQIKADRRIYALRQRDILYIEGLKDYVVVHTAQQKHITSMNLKTIHQKLHSDWFVRVSKSYVVNRWHVESYNPQTVFVHGQAISIGGVYKAASVAMLQHPVVE